MSTTFNGRAQREIKPAGPEPPPDRRTAQVATPPDDRLGELGAARAGRVRRAHVHAQRDQRRLGERRRDADDLRRGAHVRRT